MPAAARVNRVYQSWPSSCEPGFSSNSIASVRSAAVPAASSISAVLVVVISCSFFLRSSYCTSEIMRGSAAESASSAVHARLRQESVEHDGDDEVEQDDLRKTTGWCKRVQTLEAHVPRACRSGSVRRDGGEAVMWSLHALPGRKRWGVQQQ